MYYENAKYILQNCCECVYGYCLLVFSSVDHGWRRGDIIIFRNDSNNSSSVLAKHIYLFYNKVSATRSSAYVKDHSKVARNSCVKIDQ